MLVGSMATGLAAGGGFCSGSLVVTEHQRINSASFVFSASLPALLATTASSAIHLLSSTPTLFTTLQSHTALARSILDPLSHLIHIPSDPLSPLIHIQLASGAFADPTDEEGIQRQERLLQEVVEECLSGHGVLVTRARRLRGQETFEARPSIKLALCATLARKEVEKSLKGVKESLVKVLGKKR